MRFNNFWLAPAKWRHYIHYYTSFSLTESLIWFFDFLIFPFSLSLHCWLKYYFLTTTTTKNEQKSLKEMEICFFVVVVVVNGVKNFLYMNFNQFRFRIASVFFLFNRFDSKWIGNNHLSLFFPLLWQIHFQQLFFSIRSSISSSFFLEKIDPFCLHRKSFKMFFFLWLIHSFNSLSGTKYRQIANHNRKLWFLFFYLFSTWTPEHTQTNNNNKKKISNLKLFFLLLNFINFKWCSGS